MKSKWSELKENAIKLRKRGLSIRKVEQYLGVPRSTLSGWFKNVELSARQREKLYNDWKKALIKARKKAVLWHNAQKEGRLLEAKNQAIKTLRQINKDDKNILELTLAILYLGEGSKKNIETALGSSDPLILKFFIKALKNIYNFNVEKIRCELYLRADQDPETIKHFWSQTLKLPKNCFKSVSIDNRTLGSKTYPTYKGVCNLRCGSVAIKRKLLYLGEAFLKNIVEKY